METRNEVIKYPAGNKIIPKIIRIIPKFSNFLSSRVNHFSLDSIDLTFSRIASTMNSERLRYAYSGCDRIISSIRSRIGSGILTVVYWVAIHSNYAIKKLTLGSKTVVIYDNNLIGGMN